MPRFVFQDGNRNHMPSPKYPNPTVLIALGTILAALATTLPALPFIEATSRPLGAEPVPVSDATSLLAERHQDGGMIIVPAGDFIFGGQLLDGDLEGHMVFVAEFMIDLTEVTTGAFAAFVEQTGYVTVAEQQGDPVSWRKFASGDLKNHPVVFMAWDDATAYCSHVGKRLPSEVEWEKAARGDDARLWPWGNSWNEEWLNSLESGYGRTTPVGAYPNGASPYGIADLAGNVWEWTATAYVADPHEDSGDSSAEETFADSRVLRGGSWRTMANGTQTTYRKPAQPDYRRDTTGFRCAQSIGREAGSQSSSDLATLEWRSLISPWVLCVRSSRRRYLHH